MAAFQLAPAWPRLSVSLPSVQASVHRYNELPSSLQTLTGGQTDCSSSSVQSSTERGSCARGDKWHAKVDGTGQKGVTGVGRVGVVAWGGAGPKSKARRCVASQEALRKKLFKQKDLATGCCLVGPLHLDSKLKPKLAPIGHFEIVADKGRRSWVRSGTCPVDNAGSGAGHR